MTAILATGLVRGGKKVAILDADIYNPTIPQLLPLQNRVLSGEAGLYPAVSQSGIKVMSLSLLMEDETEPVLWPGPVASKALGQLWSDVIWDEIDVLFIDLPSGTGDIPQMAFKDLPLTAAIIVTSPQDLTRLATRRTIHMAQNLDVPILGLVENYSHYNCPDCASLHSLFGESKPPENIPVLDHLPLTASLAKACDMGQLEYLETPYLSNTIRRIEDM